MIAPGTTMLHQPYTAGREPGTSTVVTAEIPAVPAGPNYGVLLPDGTIWYPGSKKRLPAPLSLRIVVWALAFMVLLAAAGDFIIHSHPAWVDPLRKVAPAASAARLPTGTTGSTKPAAKTGSSSSGSAPSATLMNPQPALLPPETTAYQVSGTSTYQVVVKTTELTYVQAYSNPDGVDTGAPLVLGDVQPNQSETINASGPVAVQVAAGGATVTVLSGGKQIGTVAVPPSVPWNFWFEPASAKS